MTIYRLYAENGHRTGFWVQHRTWGNTCAQISSIAGRRAGALPGSPPLHDNARVLARTYDVRSGRPIASTGPSLDNPDDRNYSRIAEPGWHQSSDDGFAPPAAAPHPYPQAMFPWHTGKH